MIESHLPDNTACTVAIQNEKPKDIEDLYHPVEVNSMPKVFSEWRKLGGFDIHFGGLGPRYRFIEPIHD